MEKHLMIESLGAFLFKEASRATNLNMKVR